MSAKEIFKKLGYEETRNRIYTVEKTFVKKDKKGLEKRIEFQCYGKFVEVFKDLSYEQELYLSCLALDMEEIQAINKQIEEFGWNK